MRVTVALAVLATLLLGLDAYLGAPRGPDINANEHYCRSPEARISRHEQVPASQAETDSSKEAQRGIACWVQRLLDPNVAVALFTALLVLVGYLQRETMRAQHATLATQLALTRTLERPWISPTGAGELRCDPAPGEAWKHLAPSTPYPPHLKISLSNFGRSPALDIVNVRAGWEVLFDDDPLPDTLTYPRPIPGERAGGVGMVVPGAQFTWHTNFRPGGGEGSELFQQFKAGTPGLRLYMYGEITYRDSLTTSTRYFTEWCLYAKEPNTDQVYLAQGHNTAR